MLQQPQTAHRLANGSLLIGLGDPPAEGRPSPSLEPSHTSVEQPTHHEFRRIVCSFCGHLIDVPIYCGNRFCPTCSVPRKIRMREKLTWIVDNTPEKKGYQWGHLILTVRNTDTIREGVLKCVKGFRKMRQRAMWKNYVEGGVMVVEVTGRPNNWHSHIHCVIYARYWPQSSLSKLWMKCTGNPIVWIKRIPKSAVCNYLTKYLSTDKVPDDCLPQINRELKNYRMFQPFGSSFNLMKTYTPKLHVCRKCGQSSFIPLDILYGECGVHRHTQTQGGIWNPP